MLWQYTTSGADSSPPQYTRYVPSKAAAFAARTSEQLDATGVGANVGREVGSSVGACDGSAVGCGVGADDGREVGSGVGAGDGSEVGTEVGAAVGVCRYSEQDIGS